MRNCGFDNRLHPACIRVGTRRRAFSLAELVVSIGILVMMLSVAGQVFTLTIKSSGQAAALTEVSQLLRAFEHEIREDLRFVQPGQSVMVIQSNPVNAYWTQDGKEADDDRNIQGQGPATGYPHVRDPAREDANGDMVPPRADMLMFFTARSGRSFSDPEITSHLQQVVYGHAVLGEYVPTGTTPPYNFDPKHPRGLIPNQAAFPIDQALDSYPSELDVSPVPASQWHLARRSLQLISSPPPAPVAGEPPWVNALDPNRIAFGLASPETMNGDPVAQGTEVLLGTSDVIWNFNYDEWVLKPGDVGPWYLPAIFDNAVVGQRIGGVNTPFMRSRLDTTLPAQLAKRMGHYFLPNCASFKVEWSLNPRSEFVAGRLTGTGETFWFDQALNTAAVNPLNTLEQAANPPGGIVPQDLKDLFDERTPHPDGGTYSLSDRFVGQGLLADPEAWGELAVDARPNLVVFGAQRRRVDYTGATPDEFVPEDIFPGALRITVDLYDGGRRLERPIRHVMVIPIGG